VARSRPGDKGGVRFVGLPPGGAVRGRDIFVTGQTPRWGRLTRRLRRRGAAAEGGAQRRPAGAVPAAGQHHDVDGLGETSRIAERRRFESATESGPDGDPPTVAFPRAAGGTLPPPPLLGGRRRPAPAPQTRVADAPTVLSLFAAPLPVSGTGGFGAPQQVVDR